jgi:UDP-glucose 4-epimerase
VGVVIMSETPCRVLVTGGAGFIGSHVVDALREAGFTPRILDARRSRHHDRAEVEMVVGDVCDAGLLRRAMAGCRAVVHLAAAADVGEVAAHPVESERRNVRGTLQVLEAARRSGVDRVVYASTIWVYSDVAGQLVDEETPLLPPGHFYTATKLAGELYCRAYESLYGLEYTVLRFGIPYGPRARGAAVIPQFVERALDGRPLTVAGDGRQSRALVYVEDLADGVVRALAPAAANRTYNLAGAEEVTVAEIAAAVQDTVAPVGIELVPGRATDFQGATVSSERAAAELGWHARTPFREGLERYVEWHRGQRAPAPPTRRRAPVAALVGACVLGLWVLAALAGLAVLDPVADTIGVTKALLWAMLLIAPLGVAAAGPRAGRAACIGLAGAELAVAVLPWPGALGRAGHAHQVLLLVAALLATAAADAAGRRRLVRPVPERS